MNLWLLACLATCFVGAWVPAVHAQGTFEDCCLAYHPYLKRAVLQRARGYLRQEVSRSCNLPAVIFFFPRRNIMVCGNPQDRWVKNGMKLLDSRNKTLSNLGTRRVLQGLSSKEKKVNLRVDKHLVFKQSEPSERYKRNTSFLTAAKLGP